MADEATDNSYNLKATSFPPDILQEHLVKMYQSNDERISRPHPISVKMKPEIIFEEFENFEFWLQNNFNQREAAELAFSICSKLKLNDEIKFISIELFNK